jgi:hypothetical protein
LLECGCLAFRQVQRPFSDTGSTAALQECKSGFLPEKHIYAVPRVMQGRVPAIGGIDRSSV